MGSTLAKVKHNHTSSNMFALTPAFIRPTRSVFDELDLMANFFQPCLYRNENVGKCEKLNANQLALHLPADISGDQIKTTINKKTGILTVSAENNDEKEFSRNGWTGKTRSFSSFSKCVRLPQHILENEELMKQVTADINGDQLKITFPEPKKTDEKPIINDESADLIHIETVRE